MGSNPAGRAINIKGLQNMQALIFDTLVNNRWVVTSVRKPTIVSSQEASRVLCDTRWRGPVLKDRFLYSDQPIGHRTSTVGESKPEFFFS